MILFSHPTGNANVREAARALDDAGLLAEFWTSVSWSEEYLLNQVLPGSLSRRLGRRAFPHVRQDHVHCHPWIEIGRLAAREFKLTSLLRHEAGCFSVDALYRSLDSKVAERLNSEPNIRAIYAYEDGALASFRVAKTRNVKTIYELPIGYWRCYRELIEEEATLQPEWAATLQGSGDSTEKCSRKDEELALATDIVVASEFVCSTLRRAGQLRARISIVPYGAPVHCVSLKKSTSRAKKLKLLFVGALSQRKGVSYLLQAVASLASHVELTIVGERVADCPVLDAALRVHNWIPSLAHPKLLQEMCRHDVLIFPSLFEGFGLVLLEAMSQGVPVITTPHTAGPDFISDGEDGFIVPIRDSGAIAQKLEMLLDHDRLCAMSQAATRKAAKHSWEQYRSRLTSAVRQALTEAPSICCETSQSLHQHVCSSC